MIKVILWSHNGSSEDRYGGPGMSAYRLYKTAKIDKFDVSLVHGHSSQKSDTTIQKNYYICSVKQNLISQSKFIYLGKKWLRTYVKNYDVFHGLEGFNLTFEPAVEAQTLGVPSVIKLAAYRSDLASKSGWKSLLHLPERRRKMVDRISGVIAISKDIVKELQEYKIPESKIVYIPDGVNTDWFYPVLNNDIKKELRLRFRLLDLPTILFSGGINRRKNPHLLIKAMAKLKSRGLDCQLILAGPEQDNKYSQEMKNIIDNMGLSSRVVWMGFVQNISEVYQAADIFCLLSDNEGLPNALLEAMSSGLASIVTEISGTRDLIVDNENGRFSTLGVENIVEVISDYIKSDKLIKAHGKVARQKILNSFSTRAAVDAHERLFKRIISGKDANE